MFYYKVLLLLALATDVFGFSIGESRQVGIIGGDPVPISDVTYMAELRSMKYGHMCGASIFHERFVLTAAHCCHELNATTAKVAVGTDNVHTGVTYDIQKIIAHEKFSMSVYDYDICLVKLTKGITLGANVTKVKLADEDFLLEPGMALNSTGWGATEPFGDASDILRQVSVPFVNQTECQQIYKDMTDLADRMICAGEKGKSACHGDSGGPLVRNNVEVGIASFTKGCSDYPVVYTKVSAYKQWISDNIASNI